MKEVPKHEQLFVLMDANARTGRREKGQVGSKDSKNLDAYGRDTLNDSGELLLSFSNNGGFLPGILLLTQVPIKKKSERS